MMKKLLVLSLVLAVAGLANATLTLTQVSDTQAVVVSSDTFGYNAYLTVKLVIPHTIAIQTNAGGSSSIGHELYGDGLDWAFLTAAGNPSTGALTNAGQHFLITLTGTERFGAGNDQLRLLTPQEEVLGSLNLGNIPEPMTMGLLSLGALFIRKRK